MSALAIRTGVYAVADMTIEEMLSELFTVSFPDLFCSDRDGTWTAVATMRIKVQGAEFKVRSDHNHRTAGDALRELTERVRNAMKQLADAKGGSI